MTAKTKPRDLTERQFFMALNRYGIIPLRGLALCKLPDGYWIPYGQHSQPRRAALAYILQRLDARQAQKREASA